MMTVALKTENLILIFAISFLYVGVAFTNDTNRRKTRNISIPTTFYFVNNYQLNCLAFTGLLAVTVATNESEPNFKLFLESANKNFLKYKVSRLAVCSSFLS